MSVYFNQELKEEFIQYLLDNNKSFYKTYNSIFKYSKPFEDLYKKDIYSFAPTLLYIFYKSISSRIKFTTLATYNSLLADYKKWVDSKYNFKDVDLKVLADVELKKIICKSYNIFNDDDIEKNFGVNDLMKIVSGSEYFIFSFINLYWQIDGREKPENLLKLKIDNLHFCNANMIDFNYINNNDLDIIAIDNGYIWIVDIMKKKYKISYTLGNFIKEYAELTEIVYERRRGVHRISNARENNGYIFRKMINSLNSSSQGKPLTKRNLTVSIYNYAKRNRDELFDINDITMSLALKHMLIYKKTHKDMAYEKRYFNNLPAEVYRDVFNNFAKEKFAELYDEYIIK